MRTLKITLCYDGTDYHGWQVQPGLPTIQGAIEEALREIEGQAVKVHGSGRTDAGVHALAQVASFELVNPIPPVNLRKAMNRLLPHDIRVLEVEQAPPGFHARRCAVRKIYEYRIFREEICPPFLRRYVHHHPYPLNEEAMKQLAPLFAGEHDFTAFAAADEKDTLGGSKVRTIFRSELERSGELLIYRVEGNGFLKHMVRNIVGTLIEAGRGRADTRRLLRMLEPGYPAKAGPTAPGSGLFLVRVDY